MLGQSDRCTGRGGRDGVPGILGRADPERRREHLSRALAEAPWRDRLARDARRRARQALAAMDVAIDVDAAVGDLSVAEQQLVEIAKALAAGASMLILDEPTTALGLAEIARLHALLRRLQGPRRAILYVSHRLDEVVALVDKVTILKDGKVVASATEAEVAIPFIVGKMVGDVGEHYPKESAAARRGAACSVDDLVTRNRVDGVSFSVRRARSLASAACSARGAPKWPARCSAWIRSCPGTIAWKGKKVRFAARGKRSRPGSRWCPRTASSTGSSSISPAFRT